MSSAGLGVLIVGAGEMGAKHARHWREAGARIAAVYDPDGLRGRALASQYESVALPQLEECLALEEVEVVSICTPTFLHARYTVASLDAGKHVLCEKPASLTLDEALRMKAAERSSGRLLRVGFMRRFDPASHRILDFCRSIGRPILAQATIAAGVRPKLLMHDAAANGGPIIDMCCHIFDQWAALFEEPASLVRAHGYTFSLDKPEVASIERKALDSAHLTIVYPSGGVGQVQVSWGLPSGIPPIERHTYMGPDGLVTVEWPGEVVLHDGEGITQWNTGETDAYRNEIQQFATEIAGGDRGALATIDDGIAALRVSLAVLESVYGACDVCPADLRVEQDSSVPAH